MTGSNVKQVDKAEKAPSDEKVMIGNTIERPNSESQRQADMWKCLVCTLENPSNVRQCTACDTIRPTEGDWQCRKCTLFNVVEAKRCTACDTKRNP